MSEEGKKSEFIILIPHSAELRCAVMFLNYECWSLLSMQESYLGKKTAPATSELHLGSVPLQVVLPISQNSKRRSNL